LAPHAIGVDIGGTKIAAGVVDADGKLGPRAELPSDIDDAPSVVAQIAELAGRLRASDIAGIGVGAAGIVDHETGRYLYGPNTGLRDFDLAAMAADATGLPVTIDNDANCAAWAEHRFGVGEGCRDFMCVTLGTGIGGGFVFAGRPYRGAHGGAAEIGHMIVDPDGPLCGCGRFGCWEQFASGMALERMALEGIGEHPDSVLADDLQAGRIRGQAVTRAARDGDAFARALVGELARWIGVGLGSLVNVLEPQRIAIAGGLVRDWDLFADTARDAMLEQMEADTSRPHPQLLAAELGADAGVVGAAALVLFDDLV
jgi:glucokinase